MATREPSTDESRREDCALIAQLRARPGEPEACRRLVVKYWGLLLAWVRPRVQDPSEAEDIAQEAFIRAFRALEGLADPGRFVPWLLRIAWNRAADLKRRRRRDQSLDRLLADGLEDAFQSSGEDLGESLEREEGFQAVQRAVEQLPGRYRLVVLMRYFEGMSGCEIAATLGEPEGTIRNRLFRAHQKIRRLLERPAVADGGSGKGAKP